LVKELVFRFLVGGVTVSVFAVLGDLFKPKSFAGLFGAAPSVALATLGLVIMKEGRLYAATEARSMVAGAVALFVYSTCVFQLIKHYKLAALKAATVAIPVWLGTAFGLWLIFLR
jgi:uncharacterized membrane protein (GlpM family)